MTATAVAPDEMEIAPGPSLRAREDARLFARFRRTGDPDARAELVARFLPLARRLARGYANREEYDDLVQVASFALLKAIDRYDPDRGLAFSSFAVPTIVGEIKRYFRDQSWLVRPPRDLHDRWLKVHRASEQLTARLGRSPTPAELADALDIGVELVLDAMQAVSARWPDRLDAPADSEEEDRGPLPLAVEDPGYGIAEASATLGPLLARLTPREEIIVRLRFEQDLKQSEIGALLGISQMQVSRVLRRTLAWLHEFAEHSR